MANHPLPVVTVHELIATITSKGQVTVPAPLRRLWGLMAHDKVVFTIEDGAVRVAPTRGVVERTAGMLRTAQAHLSPAHEQAAFEQAMATDAGVRTS